MDRLADDTPSSLWVKVRFGVKIRFGAREGSNGCLGVLAAQRQCFGDGVGCPAMLQRDW